MIAAVDTRPVDIIKRIRSVWTEHGFQFNIPIIDLQHIYLLYTFVNLGIVCDGGDSEIIEREFEKAFSNIIEFTSEHFFLEAEIFRTFDYPEKKSHLQEHRIFINKLKDRSREKKSGDPQAARKLVGDLMSWLFDHILLEDKKYAAFFNRNQEVILNFTHKLVDENIIYITPFQLKLYNLVTDSNQIFNILNENISQTVYHMWRTYDLSLNVPLLDIQHLWFLRLMVRIDRASRLHNRIRKYEELETGLRLVSDYMDEHFRTEELFMERFAYSGALNHKKEHAVFIARLRKRVREREGGDVRAVMLIAQDLKEWLLTHIAVTDKYLFWHFRNLSRETREFARELLAEQLVTLTKGQVNLYKQVMSMIRALTSHKTESQL